MSCHCNNDFSPAKIHYQKVKVEYLQLNIEFAVL